MIEIKYDNWERMISVLDNCYGEYIKKNGLRGAEAIHKLVYTTSAYLAVADSIGDVEKNLTFMKKKFLEIKFSEKAVGNAYESRNPPQEIKSFEEVKRRINEVKNKLRAERLKMSNLKTEEQTPVARKPEYRKLDFDIFICCKHKDPIGYISRDSMIAHELYEFLSDKGIQVFVSNISLTELGEPEYKKTINQVLDNAHILVVVATSVENINSKWVKYEWDSFHDDILGGKNKKIITYLEGIDPKQLPRPLRNDVQNIPHDEKGKEQLWKLIANTLKNREE